MRDEDRVKLWDAINAYAITCGGDPSRFVYGNTPRQKAVAEIETLARAVAQAARDECIATVEAKRAEWVHDAVVAGDRRDWNGTNTYEAMDDAAQRLVAAIRSRAAAGGQGGGEWTGSGVRSVAQRRRRIVADKSGISWTDATWQVIAGCTACSPGCRECYSARLCATRFAHLPWGKGLAETITRERILTSEGLHSARIRKVTETLGYRWTGKVICRDDQLAVPLKWRQPKRIFVGDRGDLFHEQVPDGFVMDVWRTMGTCHCHTFLVLTKRPDRMASWIAKWSDVRVEPDWEPKLARGPQATREAHAEGRGQLFADMLERWGEPPAGAAFPTYDWAEGVRWWPNVLQNVWLGTSVCTVAEKAKIDQLRATPAAHRFLSLEPLLEDLGEFDLTGIDQVIVGGESGHKARPCALEWIGSVVKQCQASSVPCFVKQLGAFVVAESRACASVEQQRALGLSSKWAWRAALKSRSGSDPSEWPDELRIRQLAWEASHAS